MNDDRNSAGASEYLLTLILQRLEVMRPGLIDELKRGVEADRKAVSASGESADAVTRTFTRAEAILQRAAIER